MKLPPIAAVPGRRSPAWLDAGLAVVLAALSAYLNWLLLFPDTGASAKLRYAYGSMPYVHWHVYFWLVAITAEVAVLPLRRRYPVPVLAVTVAAAVAHWLALPMVVTPPADLAVAVAVYTVATTLPRPASTVLVGGVLLVAVTIEALVPPNGTQSKGIFYWPPQVSVLGIPVLVLAAAWFAGDSARSRRVYLAEVEQRAHDAERDRDRRAALAASSERERISRELHDVIAHALSVVVIQAQGAASALRRAEAGAADEALEAIVSTGRDALAETRRVLGVMRAPGDPELAPQPGLGDLPRLAGAVRDAGTPVCIRVTGQVRPLPEGIELSAYRIVQEALTNTMRHAGPGAGAEVSVSYGGTDLVVEVSDRGSPERPGGSARPQPGWSPSGARFGSGRGLAGMRARVAMLGGELSAGPAPDGGFLVRARLPLSSDAP